MRTPLTYYGGKQMLAEQIVALMPPHDLYLEPFAGGAAVFFAKPRAGRETLNDLDGQITAFWRVLREQPEALASAVALTPYGRAEWRASGEPMEDADDVEKARRLLVNIDQSFSRSRDNWSPPSLLKERKGRWQPRTWQDLPVRIRIATERLANVCLECGDGVDMLPRWDLPGAVIYIDPPYWGEHRVAAKHGYAHDAGPDLWPRLIDALLGIEHAAVILSGYPNEETARLDWRSLDLLSLKGVPSRGGNRSRPVAAETLWLSPTLVDQPNLLSEVPA